MKQKNTSAVLVLLSAAQTVAVGAKNMVSSAAAGATVA